MEKHPDGLHHLYLPPSLNYRGNADSEFVLDSFNNWEELASFTKIGNMEKDSSLQEPQSLALIFY